MAFVKTNPAQFVLEVVGNRLPGVGEVFEIEIGPRKQRYEVVCLERAGQKALVEREDGGPALKDARSRVISTRRVQPPDLGNFRVDSHMSSLEAMELALNEDILQEDYYMEETV